MADEEEDEGVEWVKDPPFLAWIFGKEWEVSNDGWVIRYLRWRGVTYAIDMWED